MDDGYSVELRDDGVILVHMSGRVSDQGFETFVNDLERVYPPIEWPFAAVIDVSMLAMIDAGRRRRLAELDEKNRDKDRRLNRGQAFVVRSAVIRGAVTAMYWLVKPVYPITFVGTLQEGLDWARARLVESSVGVDAPPL